MTTPAFALTYDSLTTAVLSYLERKDQSVIDAIPTFIMLAEFGIAQQIKTTLLTFLGEWFLDTTFGVPYFEDVLVKSPNRASIEAIFRARIRAVPGVARVRGLELQVERQLRVLRVTYDVDTAAGRLERVVALRTS